MSEHLYLIFLLPLLGAFINGFWGRRLGEKGVGFVGSTVIALAFVIAIASLFELLSLNPANRQVEVNFFTWIMTGSLHIPFGVLLDPLSVVMILVVTGVSFLIHIYSIGYMHGDDGFARYFAYLNLFVFFMLLLVLGNTYLVMFIGWEGVGLCSYLLIGFWFTDNEKANAGKKAFIVNRIGDFGFLIGMFILYTMFGSLTFSEVGSQSEYFVGSSSLIFWAALCLFIGAAGKSAQIPLYVWLPDAMAGPTPVSALIHAATMVTAGVYMVARNSFIYALAPDALAIIAWVGVITAIFAATIALVQTDIKKVLAYSTVSQLGYMFVGAGVGAYAAGVSHLVTHAFFKALLFLGSGSVIHAVHHAHHKTHFHGDPQDIRHMGGLRSKMPTTYWTFAVACLAIAGIPPLSGFFSKDEIIWFSFANGFWGVGIIAMIAALLTAFYMFRLLYMTFHGTWRGKSNQEEHLHESPSVMTFPLKVLGILSIIGGWIMIPKALGGGAWFEHFLEPSFKIAHSITNAHHDHHNLLAEYSVIVLSIAIAVGGILFARKLYIQKTEIADNLALRFKSMHKVLSNKYYVDEIYNASIVQGVIGLSNGLWKYFDVAIVDGIVNGSGKLMDGFGRIFRNIQTGLVGNYALFIAIGVVCIVWWMIL